MKTLIIPVSLHPYLAAAVLLMACGCSYTEYEIELTPNGDQIERKLFIWRTGSRIEEIPARDLARITPLYTNTFQTDRENKRGFVSTFRELMPPDVGGRGTYVRLTSPMGSTYMYVERFRGEDDLVAQFQSREKAVTAFVRLVSGWCKQEFGSKPGYGKLREFIGKDLSRDLLNLSLYAFPVGRPMIQPDKDKLEQQEALTDLAVRVGQYLLERDYFTIGELPQIVGAIERGGDEEVGTLLATVFARKMGLSPGHPALSVFGEAKQLEGSWNKYLATTPEYRKLLAGFKKEKSKDPNAKRPEPMLVLEQAFGEVTFWAFDLGRSSDRLTLRLHVKHPPYATSGEWDETEQAVLWTERNIDEQFPTLCFAFWSEPNGQYQTDHFGKIALDKDELGAYLVLYRGLTEQEAAEWDKFVAELKPTAELVESLEAFRFTTDPLDMVENDRSLPKMMRTMILKSLEDAKPTPAPDKRD